MYPELGEKLVHDLDGIFSFVLSRKDGSFLVARDPIGVIPLYYGHDEDGALWFASELKGLQSHCVSFQEFPPGHHFTEKMDQPMRYYQPFWWDGEIVPTGTLDLKLLRTTLEEAVVKRMMCDVPFGVLLSGGLDSSLVASIACRHARKRIESGEKEEAYPHIGY